MCEKPKPGDKVIPVRCQAQTHPCPTCGRRGRRKERHQRFVRSIALGVVVWLHVFYAEYRARCDCRKTFRSCPPNICPKADYDNLVRQAVLNRILDDGLNVERTRAAMKRDFLLDLSTGFIYDCLNWGLRQLNPAVQRKFARDHFSGILCIDELHLGKYTLLLATDPIGDRIIGYSLVRVNDQPHMRCFLRKLQYWGFNPKVVVTDGSNLYPAVLKDVWPTARHQRCVFHVLQDVNKLVLAAVRRLRKQKAERDKSERKRKQGRGAQGSAPKRPRKPKVEDPAAFVFKHRFLIVKRSKNMKDQDWQNLRQMYQYLPELGLLRSFCDDVYELFSTEQVIRLARRRRTLLLKDPSYKEVPELAKAMGLLEGKKFDKMVTFLESSEGLQVRTNNHVERANRKIRYDEKVRYKFRRYRSLDRFLFLRLGRLAELDCLSEPDDPTDAHRQSGPPPGPSPCRD